MLPERVKVLRMDGGLPVDNVHDLHSLDDRGSGDDWKAWRDQEGFNDPLYLRFEDAHAGRGTPLQRVQRAANSGEVWVDAAPENADDLLDLCFSGAPKVVAWWGQIPAHELEDAMDGMEDGVLIGWDPAHGAPASDAVEAARAAGAGMVVRDFSKVAGEIEKGEMDVFVLGSEGDLRLVLRGPVKEDDEEE